VGEASSAWVARWTAAFARPTAFSTTEALHLIRDRKAWLTFRDLAWDTELKSVSEMNERMDEASQKPVQHLGVLFAFVSSVLHVLYSGSRQIRVEIVR
jgi:hypothetical protein